MIGLTDRDLFSSEHAEAALADERNIILTGKPIIDYEEKETWRDREDTWVSTTKMPWRDTQGNIIGTFGISHDITEKKRAAELAAMRVWGKYAPVDLVRRLYREKSEPVLGGELMEISIMFSDIKGFTTLSEQLDPNRLADMLGLYLDSALTHYSARHPWHDRQIHRRCHHDDLERARAGARSPPNGVPRRATLPRRGAISRANTRMARISCL